MFMNKLIILGKISNLKYNILKLMRYRVSFSYDKIYHIIASPIMQRNARSQELFEEIRSKKQVFFKNKKVADNATYDNRGYYSIASVFMRSNNAPELKINHVLVENGTEQDAFNCMLEILKKLNSKQEPTVIKF